MANEKRLIDANEFRNRLSHVVYDFFEVHTNDCKLTNTASVGYCTETIEEVLKQTKTVDAVEVVRCKDCKHWSDGVAGCTDHVKCCKIGFYMVGENGYCVYGERRTDNG